jgi:hypothetical protein
MQSVAVRREKIKSHGDSVEDLVQNAGWMCNRNEPFSKVKKMRTKHSFKYFIWTMEQMSYTYKKVKQSHYRP